MLDAIAMRPDRETAPYVGLSPTTPQKEDGSLIEPNVSDPSAATARLEATATAEPPDEPPGTRVRSWGFFAILNAEFSVDDPMANSSMLVFPRNTARSFLSFVITLAS